MKAEEARDENQVLGQRTLLCELELFVQLARRGKAADPMFREDEVPVNLHIEHAPPALDEPWHAPKLVCEFCGHPGRVRLVVSNNTVFDGDIHGSNSIRRGIGQSQKG